MGWRALGQVWGSDRGRQGTRPTDGKGKGWPSGRRKWLVGLEILRTRSPPPAGAPGIFIKDFNAPTAVGAHSSRRRGHEHQRRRHPGSPRPHPPRQPGRQAPADLRRRGDAGREEGRACRLQLPFQPGPQPLAVRTRPPGGGLDPAALERPARGDEGARRPPPGHAVPLRAAAQAHRLSEARRRDPRRRRCADVRRHLGRGR